MRLYARTAQSRRAPSTADLAARDPRGDSQRHLRDEATIYVLTDEIETRQDSWSRMSTSHQVPRRINTITQ